MGRYFRDARRTNYLNSFVLRAEQHGFESRWGSELREIISSANDAAVMQIPLFLNFQRNRPVNNRGDAHGIALIVWGLLWGLCVANSDNRG